MPKANQPTALVKRNVMKRSSPAAGANHESVTGPTTTELGVVCAQGSGLVEGDADGVGDCVGDGLASITRTVAIV